MQKYNIFWSEKKVSAKGVPYMKATLKEENGTEHANVAIFSSFPNFADLMNGSNVMGEVKTTVNERGTSKVLEYPQTNASGTPRGNGGVFKSKQIAESMETKARNIAEAQGNKELGIKISSTMRMAVDIFTARLGKDYVQPENVKNEILYWRKWLLDNWDLTAPKWIPNRPPDLEEPQEEIIEGDQIPF